jgi:hypothetical protein
LSLCLRVSFGLFVNDLHQHTKNQEKKWKKLEMKNERLIKKSNKWKGVLPQRNQLKKIGSL